MPVAVIPCCASTPSPAWPPAAPAGAEARAVASHRAGVGSRQLLFRVPAISLTGSLTLSTCVVIFRPAFLAPPFSFGLPASPPPSPPRLSLSPAPLQFLLSSSSSSFSTVVSTVVSSLSQLSSLRSVGVTFYIDASGRVRASRGAVRCESAIGCAVVLIGRSLAEDVWAPLNPSTLPSHRSCGGRLGAEASPKHSLGHLREGRLRMRSVRLQARCSLASHYSYKAMLGFFDFETQAVRSSETPFGSALSPDERSGALCDIGRSRWRPPWSKSATTMSHRRQGTSTRSAFRRARAACPTSCDDVCGACCACTVMRVACVTCSTSIRRIIVSPQAS